MSDTNVRIILHAEFLRYGGQVGCSFQLARSVEPFRCFAMVSPGFASTHLYLKQAKAHPKQINRIQWGHIYFICVGLISSEVLVENALPRRPSPFLVISMETSLDDSRQ